MNRSLVLAASLLLPTIAAEAADPALENPVTIDRPVFSWAGGYVGLQAGYGWGESRADYFDNPPAGFTDIDPDGWLGGAYVGYNYQMSNNIILGLEIDAAYAELEGSDIYSNGNPTETDSGQLNWSAAVRGRLGYAVDRFLPYIAAGVSFGDYDVQATSSDPMFEGSWSETYTGYTIGAGAEFALTDMIIFRSEYRFTDFGMERFSAPALFSVHDVDLSTHEVRFGVAAKF